MAAPMLLKFCPHFRRISLHLTQKGPRQALFYASVWRPEGLCITTSIEITSNRCIHGGNVLRSDDRNDGSGSSSEEEVNDEFQLSARPKNHREERRKMMEALREAQKPEPTFAEQVINAAEAVASQTSDPQKTIGDLLQRLQSHSEDAAKSETEETKTPKPVNLGDLLSRMKLEDDRPDNKKKAKDNKLSEMGFEDVIQRGSGKEIFSGVRLNIFDKNTLSTEPSKSETPLFDRVIEQEMELFANVPPQNAFQEMIQWTKKGKMWHFPIDNEQGLDHEKQVPFTEHVFLEHLIDDFPKKGPIRHFMELIVVGLSKNPYLSVEEKHAQIQWFRDYFQDKMHLVEMVESNKEQISSGN